MRSRNEEGSASFNEMTGTSPVTTDYRYRPCRYFNFGRSAKYSGCSF